MPELIAAAILSAFAIESATVVVAGITALQLATAAVTIASVAGLSVAQSLLNRSQSPALALGGATSSIAAINNPSITGSVKQAAPIQRIIYGTTQCGGAVYFLQVKPPYLYLGLLLSRRRISGIAGITVGTNQVSFGSSFAFGQIIAPVAVAGQPNYPGRLAACFQDGSPGQPINPLIARDFSTTTGAGPVATLGTITGGSLYTNGVYTNVQLTGGSGSGAFATITVTAGAVSSVVPTTFGQGYLVSDSLSATAAAIGGTGSGFSVPVTAVQKFSSSFRLPGIANVVFRFDYGADYNTTAHDSFVALWGNVQIPNVMLQVKGAPVYDPRDPTQRLPINPFDYGDYWSAEATWKYSNNAALIAADWCWQHYGLRAGPGNMDWGRIAAAANRCDEQVGCADGTTQARYTADGLITLDQQPSTVMEAILSACAGGMVRPTGLIGIVASRAKTPVFTVADEHLTKGFTFTAIKGRRNLVNEVDTRFIAPTQSYQQVDGPILIRADLQTADGEQLPATVTLPLTSDFRRAERLAKIYLLNARLDASLPATLDLRALGLEEDDVVLVNSNLFPAMNGTYEVQDWALDLENAAITATLAQYDATIPDAWNPQVDEQPFVISPTN